MERLLSFVLFGEGLITGIMLTMMLGPVTMIILRYGLQVNRVAGVWAAAGTWISDLLFIVLTYWMTNAIDTWSQRPDIRLTLFLTGGFGLLIMGLLMIRVKKEIVNPGTENVSAGYRKAFIGGFLVNSLSPFTLFFWLGAAVFLHIQSNDLSHPVQPAWYYIGVMISLAAGDFTKAWLAPKLTIWLKEQHVYWVQMIAGILIAGTGLYIMALGFFE